jgi:hypothetical protein
MSGVPGVEGKPGVAGLPRPVPVPLLLPGAPVPVASTPKCEYTRCIHAESMVGHAVLLNVGALCNFVRSTLAVNWSPPPRLSSRHGIATSLPLLPVPKLPVDGCAERGDDTEGSVEGVPMPVEVELLLPGAPAELLLSERTANWICPLVGSAMMSWTCPRLSPVWLLKLVFMSLLRRKA